MYHTSERFADKKLLYIPGDKKLGREALWLGPDDNVYWDGPSSLISHHHLEQHYARTLCGFFGRLGVSSTPPSAVLDELRRLCDEDRGEPLDEAAQTVFFALLDDLYDLSEQEQISSSSVRGLVENVSIFPANVTNDAGETTVRLHCLNQVYVPGRYTHFTDAFRTYVPLLAIELARGKGARFLASSVCSGLARGLDDVVVSHCTPSDVGSLDGNWMAAIEQKYGHIER